jgi:hypothetical protein
VLALLAAARNLDTRRDFVEVCTIAAELAGRWDLVDEMRGNAERRPAPSPKPRPEAAPERGYPPIDEVRELLAIPAWEDRAVCGYLSSRAINPEALEIASVGVMFDGVAVGAVAYALPDGSLPTWARFHGRPWSETGHRLIVPMVDATGELRSVRACRIVDDDSPKRLPPGGHRAAGLIMASEFGLALLRGTWTPSTDMRVIVRVVEGEPDYLSVLTVRSTIISAVFGVVSGSWGPGFVARRIPAHALCAIETHADAAGEKYATDIIASLRAAGVAVIERMAP